MLLHDHSKTAHPGIGSLFAIAWEELKSERKNLLLAFSLANLCFINVWYLDEQIPSAAFNYFRKAPADGTLLEATFFAVVILALFFWVIWRAVAVTGSRTLARFVRAGFLLISAIRSKS